MKNYFKFMVVVFGITVATSGSIKSYAIHQQNDDGGFRCVSPYNVECATLASGKKLGGTRQDI